MVPDINFDIFFASLYLLYTESLRAQVLLSHAHSLCQFSLHLLLNVLTLARIFRNIVMEGLHYSFDIPKMALDYEFDDKFMVEHTSIINGEVALVIWQEIMRTIFQKHVHYLLSAVHTGPVEG